MTFGRANEREKSNWAGEHFSFVSPFLTVMGGGGARLVVQKCFKSHLMSQRDRESDSSHLIGADLCSPPAKTLFHLLFN